ncbi:MAG: hypothetical protein SFU98_07330 [Leptospiraceae bacterium]|nr:hypothetical protein [Leptospiraceae bacterium]
MEFAFSILLKFVLWMVGKLSETVARKIRELVLPEKVNFYQIGKCELDPIFWTTFYSI